MATSQGTKQRGQSLDPLVLLSAPTLGYYQGLVLGRQWKQSSHWGTRGTAEEEALPTPGSLTHLQAAFGKRPRCNPDKAYWGLMLEHKGDSIVGRGSAIRFNERSRAGVLIRWEGQQCRHGRLYPHSAQSSGSAPASACETSFCTWLSAVCTVHFFAHPLSPNGHVTHCHHAIKVTYLSHWAT